MLKWFLTKTFPFIYIQKYKSVNDMNYFKVDIQKIDLCMFSTWMQILIKISWSLKNGFTENLVIKAHKQQQIHNIRQNLEVICF